MCHLKYQDQYWFVFMPEKQVHMFLPPVGRVLMLLGMDGHLKYLTPIDSETTVPK